VLTAKLRPKLVIRDPPTFSAPALHLPFALIILDRLGLFLPLSRLGLLFLLSRLGLFFLLSRLGVILLPSGLSLFLLSRLSVIVLLRWLVCYRLLLLGIDGNRSSEKQKQSGYADDSD
jgi:hypothetical protein